jgi:hypothetical protein
MTYASPDWEFAATTHLLKLQLQQNKVLRTIGNFPRRTPVRELHKAFNIPYIYDYITNYAGSKQKSYKIIKNANVRNIEPRRSPTQKIQKRLKLGGGQAYYRSSV